MSGGISGRRVIVEPAPDRSGDVARQVCIGDRRRLRCGHERRSSIIDR
jgi:hypothetical protein